MLQVDRGRWGWWGVGGGGRIRHTITALPSSSNAAVTLQFAEWWKDSCWAW